MKCQNNKDICQQFFSTNTTESPIQLQDYYEIGKILKVKLKFPNNVKRTIIYGAYTSDTKITVGFWKDKILGESCKSDKNILVIKDFYPINEFQLEWWSFNLKLGKFYVSEHNIFSMPKRKTINRQRKGAIDILLKEGYSQSEIAIKIERSKKNYSNTY
ncbi:hypothetical protein A3Q56_01612 [Intoshia linei]|uniref:Uncharacterized protein n=1 Tax=Intoshia linei TaxID=1819745 RepID=A0A177B8P6_9BILA|nr:hypothetical protein A3Q56_01612 [Intoshia linei]